MIYLLLADGCEEIEALTPLDVLRRGGCEIKTVGITGKQVVGAHGIEITADITPEEVTGPIELLILPGGIPGADHLDASPFVSRFIEKTLEDGGHLAAICAAPYVLGKRGLLKGKTATCYPNERFVSQLLGATVTKDPVVTDGNITTAIGMGAASAFAVRLLSLMKGEEVAKEVSHAAFLGCERFAEL